MTTIRTWRAVRFQEALHQELKERKKELLEAQRLRKDTRCAAMELESQGYFAVRSLTTDPRWGNGSIYLFAAYGSSLFNGDPFSRLYGVSELDPYIHIA